MESVTAASKVFSRLWTTGITLFDEEALSSVSNVNPTFVYSLIGTTFSIQYGTTLIASFHVSPAFLGSNPASTTASDPINCAKLQFRDWATSFQSFSRGNLERLLFASSVVRHSALPSPGRISCCGIGFGGSNSFSMGHEPSSI